MRRHRSQHGTAYGTILPPSPRECASHSGGDESPHGRPVVPSPSFVSFFAFVPARVPSQVWWIASEKGGDSSKGRGERDRDAFPLAPCVRSLASSCSVEVCKRGSTATVADDVVCGSGKSAKSFHETATSCWTVSSFPCREAEVPHRSGWEAMSLVPPPLEGRVEPEDVPSWAGMEHPLSSLSSSPFIGQEENRNGCFLYGWRFYYYYYYLVKKKESECNTSTTQVYMYITMCKGRVE